MITLAVFFLLRSSTESRAHPSFRKWVASKVVATEDCGSIQSRMSGDRSFFVFILVMNSRAVFVGELRSFQDPSDSCMQQVDSQ
jgi:hypothetical protein